MTRRSRGPGAGRRDDVVSWVANAGYGSHVIEPIGQIIGRQASIRQDDLPDEDAQSLVFDDTNLFEWNKFSGYDRIETGTRANVGLQYTFQANYGGYGRILAGESFQLGGDNAYADPGVDADGNPVFDPYSGLETDRSDYVLGAYLAPWACCSSSPRPLRPERLSMRRQDAAAQVSWGLFSASAVAFLSSNPTNGINSSKDVHGARHQAHRPLERIGRGPLRHRRRRARLRHGAGALCRRVLRAHRDLHRQLLSQPEHHRRPDGHAALRAEAPGRVRLLDGFTQL
jgi:LPS-assembly protein